MRANICSRLRAVRTTPTTEALCLSALLVPSAAPLGAQYRSLHGPQLEADRVLTVGWQKSFAPIGHH